MKKILFPTDCSTLSHNAFLYAVELAKLLDVKIDVLSIFHLPMADASAMPPEYIEQMIDERRIATMKNVVQFIEGHQEYVDEMRADYGVFVATEIYEAAGDAEYDLIVMGTKGSHNAFEKLMGSVTTQVMMHSPCPVLAVPECAEYKPIKKAAYATDFHLKDPEMVLELLSICNALGATVSYVHVEKKPDEPASKVKTIAGFATVDHVSNASVEEGLNTYIEQNDIDLLALFMPRRGLWERLFHSSFTKKIALHTHLPLLVFREQKGVAEALQ
jgi:nucleotide-binding universal stress UspA family protein